MKKPISQLEPTLVWKNFEALNAVPRPSKKEEKVIRFMVDFGKGLGLEPVVDQVGNVRIRKPATQGMGKRKTVTLQSHLDMVHQKNSETEFDFDTQGIRMLVDGDWVRAEGTTLGADNGLGVAAIMALLESSDIPHPPLEALFTIDEETGMTGAMGLQTDFLEGRIFLNLDTEEDDEIDVGCAGGIDVTATRIYNQKPVLRGIVAYSISIGGLMGGHSGMDIHRGLGNANKIMNRLLYHASGTYNMRISEVDGGGLRNAIPRESVAKVVIDKAHVEACLNLFQEVIAEIKNELGDREPNLRMEIAEISSPDYVMGFGVQKKLLKSIKAALNGVYAMSQHFDGLTETSNNIARVLIREGKVEIGCLTRSSMDSAKMDLANSLKAAFELGGCQVKFGGNYPGWQPDPNSKILGRAQETYRHLFGSGPRIVACHAGLECGIVSQSYPDMDIISFGPTIKGAHSPDERVHIPSVQKFWTFLCALLGDIPI